MGLHNAYNRDDVICVSLSLDYMGEKESSPESFEPKVLKALQGFGAEFDNVLATEDTDTMLTKLDLGSPPGVYVYNRKGDLAKLFDNSEAEGEEEAFTYKDIEALVAKLIEEE